MKKASKVLVTIGLIELISAIIIHPEIAHYWRNKPVINFYDDMLEYFLIALVIGASTLLIAKLIRKYKSELLLNATITFIIVSSFILSDRLLLAVYGSGLWKYDHQVHFVHRPNKVFSWGEEYDNKIIRINSSGFHDREFITTKLSNEKRIFFLGNSITMGHGVTYEETFSNQLINFSTNCKINTFNLGVQGYSTMQELEILKRNIHYKPDIIFSGFCLNDITEPIYVNRDFGGLGFDYHNVYQASNNLIGFLTNETGFGRLIARLKFSNTISNSKANELKSINLLSVNPFYNNNIVKSWNSTIISLNEMNKIAKSINSKFAVLIFPYTHQFFNNQTTRPQSYLKSKLDSLSIPYIDFIETFELVLSENNSKEKIAIDELNRYYLDEDHLTKEGHQIVAEEIFNFLINNYGSFCEN